MKANEAPEKLYFENDKGILDIYSNRDSNDEVEYSLGLVQKGEEVHADKTF